MDKVPNTNFNLRFQLTQILTKFLNQEANGLKASKNTIPLKGQEISDHADPEVAKLVDMGFSPELVVTALGLTENSVTCKQQADSYSLTGCCPSVVASTTGLLARSCSSIGKLT